MYPLGEAAMPQRMWNGIRIVSSENAMTTRTEVKIERNPIKKRRRGYRVRIYKHLEPAIFWVALNGGHYVMHPSLIDRLKAIT